MADKNKPQDDLSIEEILGSIRRIIAEDDEPGAVVTEDPEDEEPPLELTNKIDADGSIVNIIAEPETYDDRQAVEAEPVSFGNEWPDEVQAAPDQDEIIVMSEKTAPEIETEQEEIILLEEPQDMPLQDDDLNPNETLLLSTTVNAASAVMAKLARHTALLEEGSSQDMTIEGIVREMLKPMLGSWLDENLPGIVQKMVEREIERLTKHL